MIFWIIQWSVLSLIFIYLLHHLYSFFIDTLTVPKVKDLINKPIDRYNELFSIMEKNNKQKISTDTIVPNSSTNTMHNELLDFLNNIKKNNNTDDQLQSTSFSDTNYSVL